MQSPGKVSATLLLSIIAFPCASSAAYLLSMLCGAVEIRVPAELHYGPLFPHRSLESMRFRRIARL
jgi:hypothetical protein